MKRILQALAVLCLCTLNGGLLAAEPKGQPFVLGMLPYNSAPVVIGQHRPMIEYLRGAFGADTEFVTAPGFRAFFIESVKGSYDVMALPSNLARLLQVDHGYVPLVRYLGGARGLVVVAANGPITSHEQLVGKTVAVPDRLALATILALEWLEQKGMRAGRDYQLFEAITFNAAAIAVNRGEAAAAVSAPAALAQMSPETRDSLRTIVDSGEISNFVFVAHPRVPVEQRDAIKKSLLAFAATSAGQAFIAATGFRDIVAVTPDVMRKLDPYVKETRRLLEQKPRP